MAAPKRGIMRVFLCAVFVLFACDPPCTLDGEKPDRASLTSPFEGYASPRYKDDALWMCRPGLEGDRCATNLDATEIRPDGTKVLVPHVPDENPAVDCFYVYPTVDWLAPAGMHRDTSINRVMEAVVRAQAARFTEACRVFVPVYRQVSLATYFTAPGLRDACLESAYGDVADAFLHYMGQFNQGRRVVLIGHSQGAQHVTSLLKEFFDDDELMRQRLVAALVVGGNFSTEPGARTGGSLENIPLCRTSTEQGCVVAYRSYSADNARLKDNAVPDGELLACVNPADPASDGTTLSRAYFSTDGRLFGGKELDADTPYVLYRGLYAGTCVDGPDGRYLEIIEQRADGDVRESPVDLKNAGSTPMGLHNFDFHFPLGDLIDQVKLRVR